MNSQIDVILMATREEPPKIFERNYIDDDGVKSTWKFNLNKNPNGPYEVIIHLPKNYKTPIQIQNEKNKKLPVSKQRFFNAETGKWVSYQRAKALKLIK